MNADLLDNLGWHQFESLCQALLKAKLGLDVEAWGGHSDRGRDAYWPFQGIHPLLPGGTGPFLFQAKFVENANAAGARPGRALEQAVAAECEAIVARRRQGTLGAFQTYVLLTNAPLTPQLRDRITGRLRAVLPGCTVLAWGSADLRGMLADAPGIRAAFPQLLSLGDLETLLANVVDRSSHHRSRAYLERARDLARTFVPTGAYWETLKLLSQHYFAVLSGPPEVGKTTIARVIGLMKDQEGWQCYDCREADEFFRLRDRKQRQIFIVDDAFGSTEYSPESARGWGDHLDVILEQLGPECWILWTSRSAPLEQALRRMNLQGRAQDFPSSSNVILDAGALTPQERALILYCHAKHNPLPEHIKSAFKSLAFDVVGAAHFTPLRVQRWLERLRKCTWAEEASADEELLRQTFQEEIIAPSAKMRSSFRQLPDAHRKVLVSLLDMNESLMREENIAASFGRIFPGATGDVRQHLAELVGHYLRDYVGYGMQEEGGCTPLRAYQWTHPTWRDLLIEQLGEDRSLRHRFLSRCGAAGAELALSEKGGAAGEREYPFLQEPADWHALTEGCHRFIQQDPYTTQHFLGAILAALGRERHRAGRGKERPELLELARSVLAACRGAWNDHPELPTLTLLELYYPISEFLSPLPESPTLHSCWMRITQELVRALQREEFLPVKRALDAWTFMVELLDGNEPRFLRQVELPESCQPMLDQLSGWLETQSRSWIDTHDARKASAHLSKARTIGRLLQRLMEASPDLYEELEPVDDMLSSRAHLLQEKAKSLPRNEPREREEDEEPLAEIGSSEPFDIRELFVDL
jgi:hypothetical protein